MADVSVIVCTRNRSRSLARTLAAFEALCVPEAITWELVVVDNGSTDDTAEIIRAALARLPIRMVSVREPGLSRARNAGIAAGTGEAFFFTDDDCIPAADWLTVGYALLRAEPRRVIGGRVGLYDARDLPVCQREGTEPEQLRDFMKMGGFCLGANLICGRAVLDEIGGFDIRLGAGTAARSNEDADFVYRAFRAAIPVMYEPSLVVLHAHGRDSRAKAEQLWKGYALGDGAMAMKYGLQRDFRPFRTLYWTLRSNLASLRRGGEISNLWVQAQAVRGAVAFFRVRRQPSE